MEHVMQLGRRRRASSPATSFVPSLGSRCDVAIIGPVLPFINLPAVAAPLRDGQSVILG